MRRCLPSDTRHPAAAVQSKPYEPRGEPLGLKGTLSRHGIHRSSVIRARG